LFQLGNELLQLTAKVCYKMASPTWCALYGIGIVFSLVIYGLLQERIMAKPYAGHYFSFAIFLVFCNRVVAILFAGIMIIINGETFRNAAPVWKYLAISCSNVAASTCQYAALKYVTFTVQVLGKNFKMMPVMVWGMLISGKRYDKRDWIIATAVMYGIMQFLLTGNIKSSLGVGQCGSGLFLLAAFIVLDGFTSVFQEKLFKEITTSKYNQMFFINFGSAIVSFAWLTLTGGMTNSILFCHQHHELGRDVVYLSVAAVGAQWFIYSQVKDFGALVCAATLNVRQVVSIMLSYAAYGHSITALQVVGLLVVFAALFYKCYVGAMQMEKERAPLLPSSRSESARSACSSTTVDSIISNRDTTLKKANASISNATKEKLASNDEEKCTNTSRTA